MKLCTCVCLWTLWWTAAQEDLCLLMSSTVKHCKTAFFFFPIQTVVCNCKSYISTWPCNNSLWNTEWNDVHQCCSFLVCLFCSKYPWIGHGCVCCDHVPSIIFVCVWECTAFGHRLPTDQVHLVRLAWLLFLFFLCFHLSVIFMDCDLCGCAECLSSCNTVIKAVLHFNTTVCSPLIRPAISSGVSCQVHVATMCLLNLGCKLGLPKRSGGRNTNRVPFTLFNPQLQLQSNTSRALFTRSLCLLYPTVPLECVSLYVCVGTPQLHSEQRGWTDPYLTL